MAACGCSARGRSLRALSKLNIEAPQRPNHGRRDRPAEFVGTGNAEDGRENSQDRPGWSAESQSIGKESLGLGQSTLEILQINLNHAKAATAALVTSFLAEKRAVALLQEPWIVKRKICGLAGKGRKIFGGFGQRPRAAVLLSEELDAILLPQFCDADTVAVSMKFLCEGKMMEVIFVSAYLARDNLQVVPEKLSNLVTYAGQKRKFARDWFGLERASRAVVV